MFYLTYPPHLPKRGTSLQCRQDTTLPSPQPTGVCSAALCPWGTSGVLISPVSNPGSLYMHVQMSCSGDFSDLAEEFFRCNGGVQVPAVAMSQVISWWALG